MMSLENFKEKNSKNLILEAINLHQVMCPEVGVLHSSVQNEESISNKKECELVVSRLVKEMKQSAELIYEARKQIPDGSTATLPDDESVL
jgi:hypothetical protein